MQKAVKDMSIVEILDKNIDQGQLAKDLATKYMADKVAEFKAKVESGEIDPIKGTDADKIIILKVIASFETLMAA